LKAASGNFNSTGFPASYPNDASKAWIIDSGARVELTFNVFSLQSCRDCSCDYVEVRDGPSLVSPLIGRYCGNRTEPIRVVSSDAYLFVYFKTDSSASERGFNARYAQTTSKCLSLMFILPFHFKAMKAVCCYRFKVLMGERACPRLEESKTAIST